jgi:trimethylamine:corrinoid methyltransferase-like protein
MLPDHLDPILPTIRVRSHSDKNMEHSKRKENILDRYQRQRPKNRILPKAQVDQVDEYALRVVEEVGCRVQCDESLDILGCSGWNISDPDRAWISRNR